VAVYVDSAFIPWRPPRGRLGLWSHMWADSVEELHAFARRLGLRREWFQNKPSLPHYDVTKTVRARALKLGAVEATRSQLVA
jgi:hypothetical protein